MEILKERRCRDNTSVERPFVVAASTMIAATKHQMSFIAFRKSISTNRCMMNLAVFGIDV
jgi:hypothetical protein